MLTHWMLLNAVCVPANHPMSFYETNDNLFLKIRQCGIGQNLAGYKNKNMVSDRSDYGRPCFESAEVW